MTPSNFGSQDHGDDKYLATVIVPTRNRASDLSRCLKSVADQIVGLGEILVIDNGSTDNTRDVIRRFPVRVLQDPASSLSRIFNLGLQNATGEIIVWINDDAVASPDWLETLLRTLRSCHEAGAAGGPTIAMHPQEMERLFSSENGSRFLRLVGSVYRIVVAENRFLEVGSLSSGGAYGIGGSLKSSRFMRGPFFVDMLSITNLAIRRDALQKIGGFDENFRFTHVDGDLFIRMRNAGYKLIFSPNAWVLHYINPSGATREGFNLSRDHAYFLMKHFRPKTLDEFLRLTLNMVFFASYWIYMFSLTSDPKFLSGVRGLIRGFTDYLSHGKPRSLVTGEKIETAREKSA
jgi:GT2 family glycosyltransferase